VAALQSVAVPLTLDIVTHYFAPIGGPGARRMEAWAAALREAGHTVRVWMPQPQRQDPFYDPSRMPPDNIEVRPVPIWDPAQLVRRPRSKTATTPKTAGPAPLQLWLRDMLRLPDHRRLWVGRVYAALRQAEPQGDLLITTSPYNSTHLVGLRAQRGSDPPRWLADLRDSWAQPWRARAETPLHRWLNRRWERQVYETADLLTWYHHAGIDEAKTRIPGAWPDKAHAVLNGVATTFLERLAAQPFDPTQTPFTFLFAGTAWDWNFPAGFETAWLRFVERVSRPVRLRFVGRREPGATAALQRLATAAPEHVEIEQLGFVDQSTLIQEHIAAGALLIFGVPGPEIMPAKLFEAVAARRPLRYFGPHNSAAGRTLNELGAPNAVIGLGAAATEHAFVAFADAINRQQFQGWMPTHVPAAFERRQQLQKLVDLVEHTAAT